MNISVYIGKLYCKCVWPDFDVILPKMAEMYDRAERC